MPKTRKNSDQTGSDLLESSGGRFSTYFNKTTVFLDQHLQEIRYVTYGLAAVGAILTVRSIHMFKQFQHAREIPAHFYTKNVRLQGIVKHVCRDGTLSVEHIPIVTIRWIRYFNKDKRLDLPVKITGVSLGAEGLPWLQQNVMGSHIWFRLIQEDQDFAHCIVKKRKNIISNICINEELVKQGIATVQFPNTQQHNSVVDKFVRRMMKAQEYAERKGRGMWERPSVMERAKDKVKEYKTGVINQFKGAVSSIWRKMTFWRKPK